ncbi:MAG TPA: carbohydrate-binding family 9-like protein [Vicinamibacteria bacterium]|nr:carbohydrate-binding family 9-like protein [Vicinamibacteria bacterium]
MEYRVRAARSRPSLRDGWDDSPWSATEALEIGHFRPEGSDHRPRARARLLYTEEGLCGLFHVEDRYVRSVHTRLGDPVYEDSCVEIFVQPWPGRGYLNFEMNAGGALLAGHVTDHRRTPGGLAGFATLADEDARQVEVRSSLPSVVEPEVEGPLAWQLAFFIPIGLVEKQVGALGPMAGQAWRANLYKCGDGTSHPHWASWSKVDERNFHLPHCFGTLRFER